MSTGPLTLPGSTKEPCNALFVNGPLRLPASRGGRFPLPLTCLYCFAKLEIAAAVVHEQHDSQPEDDASSSAGVPVLDGQRPTRTPAPDMPTNPPLCAKQAPTQTSSRSKSHLLQASGGNRCTNNSASLSGHQVRMRHQEITGEETNEGCSQQPVDVRIVVKYSPCT